MQMNAHIVILFIALMGIGCTTTPETYQEYQQRQRTAAAMQNFGGALMQYGEIQDRERALRQQRYGNALLQQQNSILYRGQQQRYRPRRSGM